MGSFNVKQKLGFLIFFAILMLVVVGGSGLVGAKRIESALNVMSEEKLPTANTLSNIRTSMATLHSVCLEASLWREKKYAQKYFKNISRRIPAIDKELTTAVAEYEKIKLSEEEAKAWEAFKGTYTNWYTYSTRTAKVIEQLAAIEDNGSNTEEAMAKQAELFDDYDMSVTPWGVVEPALQKALLTLVETNLKSGAEAIEAGKSASKTSTAAMLAIFGVAAAVLIVLGVFLARGIVKPLDSMRRAIVNVATNNDFTHRIPVTSRDEAGQTAQAFNQLIEQMQSSLREVLDNAARISSAAHSAAEVSRQVSDASDNQSESASAMAAAIEEMTVSITHINESTQDALRRAREAGDAANSGAETISQTNVEMAEIAKTVQSAGQNINEVGVQSNKISMIVQVIKDVADQTNLLALNAAIEAARAGEQGRGFAVVADEVRKLSERTAVSTGEIGKMVDAIQVSTREVVAQVGNGVKMVDEGVTNARQAGETIGGLQDMAKKVSQLVAAVDEALREQASASNDVAKKVEDVAAQAEEATAIAKQTSNAADSLTQTAHAMEQLVARFRI